MSRARNSLVPIEAIASKTCLKCKVLKPASGYKRYRKGYTKRTGEMVEYHWLDNTCRQCRWDAVKDRVNAKRRKGGQAGARNSQAKLTDDWVEFIRSPTGRRIPNVTLAQWSGVSPACIHLCKSEKQWVKRRSS